jgi:argininosuccinate lyase
LSNREEARSTPTTVGAIASDALAYTAGRDIELDLELVVADCLGTAAHVRMLAGMPLEPPILTPAEVDQVIRELGAIMEDHRMGRFEIQLADQDIHLAVERRLTERLGDVGMRIHTGRSRNDQVALDLRLYAKDQLLGWIEDMANLTASLLRLARQEEATPMVGRTHMQKAMPSSVGLWASAFAEGLQDDTVVVTTAYELNDRNPLGSAAGYGVPLPIDRGRVTRSLGLRRTIHNVLHAGHTRGKNEAAILQAAGQVMITLSRLSQDLILFSMPEFGYFSLPAEFGTGSSIMPQKNNPDVLELLRARAARVLGHGATVLEILRGSASGYNRDLQEVKQPFLEGIAMTRSSTRILEPIIDGLLVHRDALERAFTAEVFATDHVLDQVARGMPFREAYHRVKAGLDDLSRQDPREAIARKRHEGATAGLDFDAYDRRLEEIRLFVREEREGFEHAVSSLMETDGSKGHHH